MQARWLSILLVAASGAVAQPSPPPLLERVLEGAHAQVGKTLYYDGAYRRIDYPGGDVPIERGVCTDVIVRAYRHAGVDLQVRVHEDMRRAFPVYPQAWGLSQPDSNIDHRRVPNLAAFLRRQGAGLPVTARASDYAPGDIVTWRLPSGLPHIGLVSNLRAGANPAIVHNIGAGTTIEDMLFDFEITGHFRYVPNEPPAANR